MNPRVDGSLLPPSMLWSATLVRGWQHVAVALAAGATAWRAQRHERAVRLPDREEWEIRRQQEKYMRATDHQHLERLEREWDRRNNNAIAGWEWR